jgi:c-di-GMP-binding flagellar brake protein YcgR
MPQELRSSPRVPLDRFIVCLRSGDLVVTGNLSSGGVGFESSGPLKIGEPVCVSLLLPETGEPASISAIIRHVEVLSSGRYYVGVRFLEVDHFIQSPLDRYVEEAALLASLA